tara:strand:- start:808 stop:1275 length:468 start_codon:yes stop_codon:yes gene_type:complete
MIKKFIFFIIIFNFFTNCGFTPIYSNNTNLNFSISSIKFEGDKVINNFLKTNLSNFRNNKYDRKFTIEVKTTYNKNILSKDKSAKTTNYELTSQTLFQIKSNGKTIKNLTVNEKKIMDNINDDLEEQKNERTHKQNFASSISNKLLSELSMLNDN